MRFKFPPPPVLNVVSLTTHPTFFPLSLSLVFKGLNSVNQLIFVMAKCGVLFEVRTEFLNNI
jgi:hypothetical protein